MIGYWFFLGVVVLLGVLAGLRAYQLEDVVLTERRRAAGFEAQAKTLGEEKRQAEAQRDAFRAELSRRDSEEQLYRRLRGHRRVVHAGGRA